MALSSATGFKQVLYFLKKLIGIFSFALNSINIFKIYGNFGYDVINGRCEAISLWPNCSRARSGSIEYLEQCQEEGLHGGQVIYLRKIFFIQ